VGRYIPNVEPLRLEIREKEAELSAQEGQWESALSRLDRLAVSDGTRKLFERFVSGEMTIEELNAEISEYLRNQDDERR
jgi:hypothetical protein